MKKFAGALIFLFLTAALCPVFCGCAKKPKENKYFVDFASRSEFSSAELCPLRLPEGTEIYSYDSKTGVFKTRLKVNVEKPREGLVPTYLYGLASENEIYVEPEEYTGILGIKGDYAIATKPANFEQNGIPCYGETIGVIKFRGENPGEMTDFSVKKDDRSPQYRFVGDYVAASVEGKDETVFYACVKSMLLEKFRVRLGKNAEFLCYGDYLTATAKGRAYFYKISEMSSGGFLSAPENAVYIPYPNDRNAENVEISVFYLGNGWFSRTAKRKSYKEFKGYNIEYVETDRLSGKTKTVYATISGDFFNIKNYINGGDNDCLIVEMVANKYSSPEFAEICAGLTNAVNYDSEKKGYEYCPPFFNPAAMIKDGYSIVYFYDFPYREGEDEKKYLAETSFCVMNEKIEVKKFGEILMPLLFVDGVGTECADPDFADYKGDAVCYGKELERKILREKKEDDAYAVRFYHDGAVLCEKTGDKDGEPCTLMGQLSPDGKEIVPFEYDELSPFYGDFAIGYKADKNNSVYRLAKNGEVEELITDALSVRQGVYIFNAHSKQGVKNFAGKTLLEANYDEVGIYEDFLVGGKFQTTYVTAKSDGKIELFVLK